MTGPHCVKHTVTNIRNESVVRLEADKDKESSWIGAVTKVRDVLVHDCKELVELLLHDLPFSMSGSPLLAIRGRPRGRGGGDPIMIDIHPEVVSDPLQRTKPIGELTWMSCKISDLILQLSRDRCSLL